MTETSESFDKVDPEEIIQKLREIILFLRKLRKEQDEKELRNTPKA